MRTRLAGAVSGGAALPDVGAGEHVPVSRLCLPRRLPHWSAGEVPGGWRFLMREVPL